MSFFSVKNFEKFQHYKDRSPPWIKLYNELLDDYEFGLLPDASKMHLVAIWLLASRSENKIPYDPEWVARRINATEPVNLELLGSKGFILLDQQLHTSEHFASKPIAKCLSREREEGEERREDICPVSKPRTRTVYSDEFESSFWKPFPRTEIMSKKEAWREWMKLDPEQRRASCQAIEPYKRHLAKNPTLHAVHACRFLSQNRAEGILEIAGEKPKFDIRAHLV